MTQYKGPQAYDDDIFFEQYMERRVRKENANDTLEKPVLLELVGEVKNKVILDLGCGGGAFGEELLAKGCREYTGLDGSKNMFERAQQRLQGLPAKVVHSALEDWTYPPEHYDLVVSRLVLHYLENVQLLFKLVHDTLKSGGRFVFSIEHPVITSSYNVFNNDGRRQDWVVDQYFHMGQRSREWLGVNVTFYHRTIEEYFSKLTETGFRVESVRESHPQRKNFEAQENYERRMRIPLFLFFSGLKE